MEFEDFLRWNNINLKFESIASYINGFAYYDGKEYLVIINSRCSYSQQQETTIHELIHIFENHFLCASGYEERCEKEVDNIIQNIKNTYNLTV